MFKLSKNFFHAVAFYHPRVLNINFDILIKMFLGFLCWSLDIILKFNWGWKLSEFWVSKWRKLSSLYRAHLPELIEHGLVFEIELMENPINSSPFAVLYPYLRAGRWWDMLYSNTKIQLFRHHYPENHHQPNPYIQWLGSKIFLFRKSNLIVFLYCSKFYDGALSKTTRLFSGLTSSQASKLH